MTTANLKRKLRLPKCESYKAANSSFILFYSWCFRFSHPKSSKGRNRESGPLSVYFLYISSLKPEYDLIGSPKNLFNYKQAQEKPVHVALCGPLYATCHMKNFVTCVAHEVTKILRNPLPCHLGDQRSASLFVAACGAVLVLSFPMSFPPLAAATGRWE